MTEEEKKAKKKYEETYGEAPSLDFSGIKNAEAIKLNNSVSKDVVNKINNDNLKKQKSKFCFTEEHEVQIPCGCLYSNFEDEYIKRGIVRLQPMSLADEEILANQAYIKNGTTFIKLLNSCMLNDFDARNFVPYDLFYLLYTLRQITYGSDYKFKIACGNCSKEFEYELNMDEIEFQTLENETLVKTIKLPVSKYTVVMRAVTLGDEEAKNKISKKYSDFGEAVLNFVVRTEEITDNKGDPVNPDDYADFYSALPGKDRAEISKAFKKFDELEIPKVNVVCEKCGEEIEMEIPFNKEFFRY